MKTVRMLVAGLALGFAWTTSAALAGDDPLRSPGWHLMEDRFFQGATVVHDDRVRVMAPPGAEDTTAVHGFVRVDGIDGIQRLLVFADLNPIPRILEMWPHRAMSAVGFQFKVQQATPLRAAVQTVDGTWHVGGTWVDAAGGGCSAPSIASANPEWQDRLGDLRGRIWQLDGGRQRLSFSVIHPMDTGLAPGIPLFYVEEIEVHGGDGERLATLKIDASMTENPEITLEIPGQDEVRVSGRDNNGNRFAGALR